MSESTAIEQPAVEDNSINADLAEAFSGYDDEWNEVESEEVAEVEEVEPTEEVEEGEADESEESEESEEVEEVATAAPDHWSASDKETFGKAPPELQSWLLERHKSMEGDYTRKTKDIADIKRDWEPVQELFAPHAEEMRATGQTPAGIIKRWSDISNSLTSNPQQTIQWLANQYGVTMGEQAEAAYVDPAVQNLQQELHQLKQAVVQRENAESQQRLTTVQNDLQTFADQKTEAGELAHPHFEAVVDDMVSLARVEQNQGRTPTVGDLYEKAVWSNPEVREKVLAAQRDAAAKQAEKAAKAKTVKAKRAQKTLKASPDGDVVSELSLREQLEQAYS